MLALSAVAVRSGRPILVLGVILLDLFTISPRNHTGPFVSVPFPATPLLEPALADQEAFRIANEAILPGNYGVPYRLEEIGGASPLRLASLDALTTRVALPRVWALLNVKYVLTDRETIEAPAERVATGQAADGRETYLYRLADPAPRAWLVGEVVVEPDPDRQWQRLADPGFDPRRQVLLAEPVDVPGAQPGPDCSGTITWQERAPERLALDVQSQQACVLVLSELAYPGWRATIDGAETPLLRADGLLRGLVLPAGEHRIELVFRPTIVYWGWAITLASLLAIALLILWSWRSRPARDLQDLS
jgi:hypothetical protein